MVKIFICVFPFIVKNRRHKMVRENGTFTDVAVTQFNFFQRIIKKWKHYSVKYSPFQRKHNIIWNIFFVIKSPSAIIFQYTFVIKIWIKYIALKNTCADIHIFIIIIIIIIILRKYNRRSKYAYSAMNAVNNLKFYFESDSLQFWNYNFWKKSNIVFKKNEVVVIAPRQVSARTNQSNRVTGKNGIPQFTRSFINVQHFE